MNKAYCAAVVVTYNRAALLLQALAAIQAQTLIPDRIFVVDNASTDDTRAKLSDHHLKPGASFTVIGLRENTGGAGGFAAGMHAAIEAGCEWIWMMDDDALPYPDALERLLDIASEPENIYGSLAVNGFHTSWPTTLLDDELTTDLASEVPMQCRVESIPLLGFLVHRQLIRRVGYPDPGFFIAADDIEYCLRARRAGAEIFIAGQSRIEHPRAQQYVINIMGAKIRCLSLPPWKRYYDMRNRLLIARKYYGFKMLYQTIPGSLARMAFALMKEHRKIDQLRACVAGIIDGLLGRKGRLHSKWNIK